MFYGGFPGLGREISEEELEGVSGGGVDVFLILSFQGNGGFVADLILDRADTSSKR